jgi:hypothetical protein
VNRRSRKTGPWQEACAGRHAVWQARDRLHQLYGEMMLDGALGESVDLGETVALIREAIDHANSHLTRLMIVFSRTAGPAAEDAQATLDAVLHEAEALDRLDPDNDGPGPGHPPAGT